MEFDFKPTGVCSRSIHISLDGDVIHNVIFEGGCNGNANGISRLIAGMKAQDVIARLKGVHCGFKDTSCPDQLAHALEQALSKQAADSEKPAKSPEEKPESEPNTGND